MHVTPAPSMSSGLSTLEIDLTFDVAEEIRAFIHPGLVRTCDLLDKKKDEEIRVVSPRGSSTAGNTTSISVRGDEILKLSRSKCQIAFDVAADIKAIPWIKAIPDGLRAKYTSDSEFYVETKVEEEPSHVMMKKEYMAMAENCKQMLAALRSSLAEQIKREDMEAQGIEDYDAGDECSEEDDSEEDSVEIPVIKIGCNGIVGTEDYFADTEDVGFDTDDEDDEEVMESRAGLGGLPSHERLRNEYMSIAAEIFADLAKIRASIRPAVERKIEEEAARKAVVDEN